MQKCAKKLLCSQGIPARAQRDPPKKAPRHAKSRPFFRSKKKRERKATRKATEIYCESDSIFFFTETNFAPWLLLVGAFSSVVVVVVIIIILVPVVIIIAICTV